MANKYFRSHLKAQLIGSLAKVEALKNINHTVIKGRLREVLINEFLAYVTPGAYGITSGKVVDSFGNESYQMDIIVYFKNAYPIVVIDDCTSLVPIESVAYVIEVKTSVTLNDLRKTWDNFKQLYDLRCRDINSQPVIPKINCWIFSPKKSFHGEFHTVCKDKLKFDGSILPYISGIISDKEYCYYGDTSGILQWHYGVKRNNKNDYVLDFATGYINTLLSMNFFTYNFGNYISDE